MAVLFVTASCSTGRKAAKTTPHVVTSAWKAGDAVVSKANVRITDAKGKSAGLNGTLKMKYGDVVQLNLTYLLGIPVGTLELTQDSVLIVSRVTRQYSRIGYEELSARLGRDVTFAGIQSMFWGEATDLMLTGFEWKYGTFVKLSDDRRLPGRMDLSVSRADVSVSLSLDTPSYKYDDAWISRTAVNGSAYTRLTAEELFNVVLSLLGR
ncbi:MAG: DUF4292 domain-containing protein [Bacteroidaceae bacterium]|nr:DUF4292 domain-containing protein [Bacteroidaceae bacterium]